MSPYLRTKTQAPRNKQEPILNCQTPKRSPTVATSPFVRLLFGIWSLFAVWCLCFGPCLFLGAWDLGLSGMKCPASGLFWMRLPCRETVLPFTPDKPASYNDHHRDDRDDLDDLDDLAKTSGAVNPPAERMGTGMGNRAFDTRHSPRAIREAPADFPPSRKHPHKHAKPLDCGEPSPLSLSKWLTSLFSKKDEAKPWKRVLTPLSPGKKRLPCGARQPGRSVERWPAT